MGNLDTRSSEKKEVENQSIGFSPKLLFVSLSALAFIFIMAVSAVWIWLMLFRSPPFDSHIKKMLCSSCTKRSVVNIYSGSILVIQDYFIPQMLPINSHLSRSWTLKSMWATQVKYWAAKAAAKAARKLRKSCVDNTRSTLCAPVKNCYDRKDRK